MLGGVFKSTKIDTPGGEKQKRLLKRRRLKIAANELSVVLRIVCAFVGSGLT